MGLASAEGKILPFPIGFHGRPYNTVTLPCERVQQNVVDCGAWLFYTRVVLFCCV